MDAKFLLLTGAVSLLGFGSAWIVSAHSPTPASAPVASPSQIRPAQKLPATQSGIKDRMNSEQAQADAFLKADARAHAAAMAYSESPSRAMQGRAMQERRSVGRSGNDSSVYYAGCNAVRAAGAAPLYAGQPGYRPEMDGDSDGIACEPHRH